MYRGALGQGYHVKFNVSLPIYSEFLQMVPVIVNFCGINRIGGSFTFNNLQGVLGNPSSINSHDTYIKNKNLHLYTGYIKFLNIQ